MHLKGSLIKEKIFFHDSGNIRPIYRPISFHTLLKRAEPCSGGTRVYWGENDLQKWHREFLYDILGSTVYTLATRGFCLICSL